jgi:hypothetical protein
MGHVWGQERCIQGLGEGPDGKRPLGDTDVDGRTVLKRIFKKCSGETRAELIWLRIGTRGGLM